MHNKVKLPNSNNNPELSEEAQINGSTPTSSPGCVERLQGWPLSHPGIGSFAYPNFWDTYGN